MSLVFGKVALVTGSGDGIGRATALKFAEEGAKVVVSDVNVEGGNETVALVKQSGGDAVFVRADVATAADVEALVASVVGTMAGSIAPAIMLALKARSSHLLRNQWTISITSCQ